jgi:hypothetical protein
MQAWTCWTGGLSYFNFRSKSHSRTIDPRPNDHKLLSICITGIIGGGMLLPNTDHTHLNHMTEFLLDSLHSNKGDRKISTLAIMLKVSRLFLVSKPFA